MSISMFKTNNIFSQIFKYDIYFKVISIKTVHIIKTNKNCDVSFSYLFIETADLLNKHRIFI